MRSRGPRRQRRTIAPAVMTWMAILLAITSSAAARMQDWPQYRGPERTGISSETGLLKSWPSSGPKEIWRRPLGGGFSGISVAGDRLYTMFSADGAETLACFKVSDGSPVWSVRLDENRPDDMGEGPRATPTVEGDVVYAMGANALMGAFKASTGEKLWQKDLKREFGARIPRWGASSSPLVEGSMVIVDVGGDAGKSLVALDRKSGATKWTSQTDRPGYSAPIAAEILGVRQILSFAGSGLMSVAAKDGTLLWSVPWQTSYDVNAATPIFLPPDRVFISSGYDTGGAVYQIRKDGSGFSANEVWRNRVMKNHFNSSVAWGGHIYGFDDATLKCVDEKTGTEAWRQRGFAKGSLLMADGHLVILSEGGLLALAEATPEAYKESGRAQVLQGRTWTMPTLAGGRLYLRNEKEMVALDLKGGEAGL